MHSFERILVKCCILFHRFLSPFYIYTIYIYIYIYPLLLFLGKMCIPSRIMHYQMRKWDPRLSLECTFPARRVWKIWPRLWIFTRVPFSTTSCCDMRRTTSIRISALFFPPLIPTKTWATFTRKVPSTLTTRKLSAICPRTSTLLPTRHTMQCGRGECKEMKNVLYRLFLFCEERQLCSLLKSHLFIYTYIFIHNY